jgi:hypothetical protein
MEITSGNQNAATITPEFFPDDLREMFSPAEVETMPAELAGTIPPRSTK